MDMYKRQHSTQFLFITACFLFLLGSAVSAETGTQAGYNEDFMPFQTFRYALGRNNGKGFEPFRNTSQYIYTFESPLVSARTGLQLTSGTFDYTADGVWWFARTPRMRFGLGGLYHYLLFEGISATNDFMAGLHFQTHPVGGFIIDTDLDIQYKIDQIFAIKKSTPWLKNTNPAFRVRFSYDFSCGAEIYSEVASYEYFRYMLFYAPSYTFGALYRWQNGLWAGAEIVPRYTDQMTLSAYYDGTEIRAFFGFRF